MLTDDELNRLRQQFTDAAIASLPIGDRAGSWDDLVFDPGAPSIRAFLGDEAVPADVRQAVERVVMEIGLACAGAVLEAVPLSLEHVRDRRWRLQRDPSESAGEYTHRRQILADGMPQYWIDRFELLADMPVDLGAVDAAAPGYVAAVRAAGGAYEHALAGVWRAWHADDGDSE